MNQELKENSKLIGLLMIACISAIFILFSSVLFEVTEYDLLGPMVIVMILIFGMYFLFMIFFLPNELKESELAPPE